MVRNDDKIQTEDVFVLLPGIMGSTLVQRHGERKKNVGLWSPTPGGIGRALRYRTKNLLALRLDYEPTTLDEIPTDIIAERLMPDVHLIPRFWKIDGYSALRKFVLDTFDVAPGKSYFEFPFDWRLDNRLNAELLKQKAEGWLKARRAQSPNAKLVLIAHSMGGLVSRYFIEVLGGWRDTCRLFTIGTPHRGSINVLDFLANGYRPVIWGRAVPELEVFTELIRSFTSTYQMVPIYPCFEAEPGRFERATEIAGIEGLDPRRVAAGLAFHAEIRSAHEENLKNAEYHKNRYQLHAVVGSHQETLQSVSLAKHGLEVRSELANQDLKGDGTVPYASALPLEMEEEKNCVETIYVPEKHGRLHHAAQVHSQIGGIFKTATIDLGAFRDLEKSQPLGLELPDAFIEDEDLCFRVRCEDDWIDLTAILFDAETNTELDRIPVDAESGEMWRQVEGKSLRQGTYRLQVISVKANEAQPVSDVFTVL